MIENPKPDSIEPILSSLGQPPGPVPSRGFGARLRTYFFTGLLVAGPLAITFYITLWLIDLIDGWVRPLIPAAYNPETYLNISVPGVGIVAALVGLTLLGFLTANILGRTLIDFGERILDQMPFVRSVYKGVKQIFETVFKPDGTSFRRVGIIEWPGPGMWSLCLIAGETNGQLAAALPNAGYLNIFVPCSPNPTTGYFVVMHESRVKEIDVAPDDVFKVIMSMGIIQPQAKPETPPKRIANDVSGPEPGDPV